MLLHNSPAFFGSQQTSSAQLSTLGDIWSDYTQCNQHRSIVYMVCSMMQSIVLSCPTALVWLNLGEGKSSFIQPGEYNRGGVSQAPWYKNLNSLLVYDFLFTYHLECIFFYWLRFFSFATPQHGVKYPIWISYPMNNWQQFMCWTIILPFNDK